MIIREEISKLDYADLITKAYEEIANRNDYKIDIAIDFWYIKIYTANNIYYFNSDRLRIFNNTRQVFFEINILYQYNNITDILDFMKKYGNWYYAYIHYKNSNYFNKFFYEKCVITKSEIIQWTFTNELNIPMYSYFSNRKIR